MYLSPRAQRLRVAKKFCGVFRNYKAVLLTCQEKAWLIEMGNGAKIDNGPLEAWRAKMIYHHALIS